MVRHPNNTGPASPQAATNQRRSAPERDGALQIKLHRARVRSYITARPHIDGRALLHPHQTDGRNTFNTS